MELIQVTTLKQIAHTKELFKEYFEWLSDTHGVDLSYQGIEDELASLPGEYAPPRGCLLIGYEGELPVACGALRPLDQDVCELKRMYVRPSHRGKGLGRVIAQSLMERASAIGYRRAKLDTATFMYSAQELYRSLGFHEITPYYEVPPEIKKITVFMEADLKSGKGRVHSSPNDNIRTQPS